MYFIIFNPIIGNFKGVKACKGKYFFYDHLQEKIYLKEILEKNSKFYEVCDLKGSSQCRKVLEKSFNEEVLITKDDLNGTITLINLKDILDIEISEKFETEIKKIENDFNSEKSKRKKRDTQKIRQIFKNEKSHQKNEKFEKSEKMKKVEKLNFEIDRLKRDCPILTENCRIKEHKAFDINKVVLLTTGNILILFSYSFINKKIKILDVKKIELLLERDENSQSIATCKHSPFLLVNLFASKSEKVASRILIYKLLNGNSIKILQSVNFHYEEIDHFSDFQFLDLRNKEALLLVGITYAKKNCKIMSLVFTEKNEQFEFLGWKFRKEVDASYVEELFEVGEEIIGMDDKSTLFRIKYE